MTKKDVQRQQMDTMKFAETIKEALATRFSGDIKILAFRLVNQATKVELDRLEASIKLKKEKNGNKSTKNPKSGS